jgi:hypothetical protein
MRKRGPIRDEVRRREEADCRRMDFWVETANSKGAEEMERTTTPSAARARGDTPVGDASTVDEPMRLRQTM